MKCLQPVVIKNPLWESSSKNASGWRRNLRMHTLSVPCGKCIACETNYANQWTFRLQKHADSTFPNYFITLTYDDAFLPFYNSQPCFNKKHIQNWFKVVRMDLFRSFLKSVGLSELSWSKLDSDDRFRFGQPPTFSYFLISEYGGKFHRPHYHALFFGYPDTIDRALDHWKYGMTQYGDVTPGSIRYCTKYFVKDQKNYADPLLKPFRLSSNGLGLSWCDRPGVLDFLHRDEKPSLHIPGGGFCVLPKYYIDKFHLRYNDHFNDDSAFNLDDFNFIAPQSWNVISLKDRSLMVNSYLENSFILKELHKQNLKKH